MEFNGLRMTLRSHEVKAQGYRFDHEGGSTRLLEGREGFLFARGECSECGWSCFFSRLLGV